MEYKYKECEWCDYGNLVPQDKPSKFKDWSIYCIRLEGNPCPHDEEEEKKNENSD